MSLCHVFQVDRQYHETGRVKYRLSDVQSISFGGADPDSTPQVIYSGCMSSKLLYKA